MDAHARLLVDSYLARLAREGLAPGTRRNYRVAVEHFLSVVREPKSATRQDVDVYLDGWHAESGPSAGTVRLRLAAIKSFYRYLDDMELLEGRNPAATIKGPKVKRKPNDWLREEESKKLLAACVTDRERIVIFLLRWTGVRVGETAAIRVADVDMERGEIRVRMSKTQAGLRAVPIVDELGAILTAHLEKQGGDAGQASGQHPYTAESPLLATRTGKPMQANAITTIVKRVAHRAGIRVLPGEARSAVSPHTLRRTYGSDLLNRGMRLESVSKLLGHSDTRVTEACYAELLPETVHDEVRKALAS